MHTCAHFIMPKPRSRRPMAGGALGAGLRQARTSTHQPPNPMHGQLPAQASHAFASRPMPELSPLCIVPLGLCGPCPGGCRGQTFRCSAAGHHAHGITGGGSGPSCPPPALAACLASGPKHKQINMAACPAGNWELAGQGDFPASGPAVRMAQVAMHGPVPHTFPPAPRPQSPASNPPCQGTLHLRWLHPNLKPYDTCAQTGKEQVRCTTTTQLARGAPAPSNGSPPPRAPSSALALRAL